MIIGFEKAFRIGKHCSPISAFLNQIKYFRARCNSSPAVKSANRFCGRNGAIPLPTVKVRMREDMTRAAPQVSDFAGLVLNPNHISIGEL